MCKCRVNEGMRRMLILMAVVMAAVWQLCLPVRAQINAEQVLTIGRNVLSMEDYMLSIQYFNQAIKAKPYMSDPYFFRALAKLNLEDYKGAEEDCTLAIERNKYKTESYKLRGFARQCQGKDSLAILDYDLGLAYNPYDKYFLYYKGVAQTELKKYAEADTVFGELLRLFPRFDDGYTARAHMHSLAGDTVSALADLGKAIELNSVAVNPYLMRAQIESQQREWDAAQADLNEAIRLRPQEADLYVNRAYLRYNLDDFFGAMSDYNYALELEPYNSAALFNRALLRYEVKDLDRSAADLESVLKLEPDNFHARFNLGLVDMERGKNREALAQFKEIVRKYPRFYQVYYAIAETYRNMGDMRQAMKNAYYAEDLVKKYVTNPDKNVLDRPAIAAGKSNDGGHEGRGDEESETEVMERFNQLVTVAHGNEPEMSFNEKIKGKVQDRNLQVEPEPSYAVSFFDTPVSLRTTSNYFRELDEFNQRGYISDKVSLIPLANFSSDQDAIQTLFDRAAYYEKIEEEGVARPADRMALGVLRLMLKDYGAAIRALDKAIAVDGRFTIAYMARAIAHELEARRLSLNPPADDDETMRELARQSVRREYSAAIADYDTALAINPRLVFAWFNKGNIYYSLEDYTSAMQCYGEAMRIDSEFGQVYYNRGICYLQMGNKRQAFSDLSKAGELGVLPSYNLLKRMK